MGRILRRPRREGVRNLFGGSAPEISGVGERFIEIVRILDFFAFENRAAIEAFDVLRIVVFGDEALALVWAGCFSHCRKPFLESRHYNIAATRAGGFARAGLEFQFRNEFQQSNQIGALFRGQCFPDFIVGVYPCMDETLPVIVAFSRQLNVNRFARFSFLLRHKPFPDHCLDGPMHHGPVDGEKSGDLILIERGAVAQRG